MLAVQAVIDDGGKDTLQKMYANWPFFSVTLDMMEMVFAKADPRVAEFYEKSLVAEELWGFGTDMRKWAPSCCLLSLQSNTCSGLLPESQDSLKEVAGWV